MLTWWRGDSPSPVPPSLGGNAHAKQMRRVRGVAEHHSGTQASSRGLGACLPEGRQACLQKYAGGWVLFFAAGRRQRATTDTDAGALGPFFLDLIQFRSRAPETVRSRRMDNTRDRRRGPKTHRRPSRQASLAGAGGEKAAAWSGRGCRLMALRGARSVSTVKRSFFALPEQG